MRLELGGRRQSFRIALGEFALSRRPPPKRFFSNEPWLDGQLRELALQFYCTVESSRID